MKDQTLLDQAVLHAIRVGMNRLRWAEEGLDGGVVSPADFRSLVRTESKKVIDLTISLSKIAKHMDTPEPLVNISDILQDLVIQLVDMCRASGITLRSEIDPDIMLKIHPILFDLAIVSMLDNAVKYTDRGGEIDVSLSGDSERFELEIRDNGIGIPSAELSKIWELGYRANNARQRTSDGTGVGLNFVRKILSFAGCSISVNSSVGRGTSVLTIFQKQDKINAMTNDGPTVYVIEDDAFLRSLEITKLQEAGYNAQGYGDGESGMNALWDQMPDLLILDLLLPKMHGFEILEKIRANPKMKSLKVIIFSNLGTTEDIKKGKSLGVDMYLIKASFTLDELLQKVKEYLAK